MPYIVDLEKRCDKIRTMNLSPFGWKNPVCIEYGKVWINMNDPQPSICMRVRGTTNVWATFERELNIMSHGNYGDYFTKQLEEFRINFLVWAHTPIYWELSWFKEYASMYEGYFYDFTKEEQEDFERNEADAKRKSEQITRVAERIKEQTTPWNRNF